MALVYCPDCDGEVSDSALACPRCGCPVQQRVATYRGPPVECWDCGGTLKKGREAHSEGSGCIIIILGILLAPIGIGIILIIYGLHVASKCEGFWRCKRCGAKFQREIRWWEFG